MGKVVGFVCARTQSERLLNKNIIEIDGKTLIEIAAEKLWKTCDEVYVVTNYNLPIDTISHPHDSEDAPLQETVKRVMKERQIEASIVVILMPTNPYISELDIERAIEQVYLGNNICRSYNAKTCDENGLCVVQAGFLHWRGKAFSYDPYTSAIFTEGIEIHTIDDVEESWDLP